MQFDLDSNTPFFVIASDGVWEMVPEQIIGSICRQHLQDFNAEAAAKEVCQRAHQSWQKNMIGYIDDITCIVGYFQPTYLA